MPKRLSVVSGEQWLLAWTHEEFLSPSVRSYRASRHGD
jgi:hypothetical protein